MHIVEFVTDGHSELLTKEGFCQLQCSVNYVRNKMGLAILLSGQSLMLLSLVTKDLSWGPIW